MKSLLSHPLLLEWITAFSIIVLMIMGFPTRLCYYLFGLLLISFIARIARHLKG